LVAFARYYKLAVDQNSADGQFSYGVFHQKVRGVAIDLIGAARYYKLAVD
jgi:TPR repeat protein